MEKMLRNLINAAEKLAGSTSSDLRDADLSTWEFVDASQSDDEVDLFSLDGDAATTTDDAEDSDPSASPVETVSIQAVSSSLPMPFLFDIQLAKHDDEDEDAVGDGDDDDCDGGGDYDDELMPWELKDRFGKERIKKLGKRGPKPNRAKRMPIYNVRAGCVFGKHGYGVRHSLV